MRDKAQGIRKVLRELVNTDSKILYIVPSIGFYKREILPEIEQLMKYVPSLKLSISNNVLSIKGKEGYVLFRVPDTSKIQGAILNEVFVDEAAVIEPEMYAKISSLIRPSK